MWQISYPPTNGASLGSYFFSPFYFASPELIEVKICYRQMDRQTNSLTPYLGVCGFFLQVKFATSLLASLAGVLPDFFILTFLSFYDAHIPRIILYVLAL